MKTMPITEDEISRTGKLLPFAKMQALGNDFVVIQEKDLLANFPGYSAQDSSWSKIAFALCHRHFGIGADGLIVVKDATTPDCALAWQFLNNDGSQSAMCGNGLRCLALFARENNLITSDAFQIETQKGPIAVIFKNADCIQIDLGEPILESNRIPASGPERSPCLKETVKAGDTTYDATFVSMGNPHCVIFQSAGSNIDEALLASDASAIQSLAQFPQGVNVEFAYIESPKLVKVFVWERGVGKTLACASGAAATVVAGVLAGVLERKVEVVLPGGSLSVNFAEKDNHVRIIGPARQSYTGAVDLARLLAEAQSR